MAKTKSDRKKFRAGDVVQVWSLFKGRPVCWRLELDETEGVVAGPEQDRAISIEIVRSVACGNAKIRDSVLRETIAKGGWMAEVAALQLEETEGPTPASPEGQASARCAVVLGCSLVAGVVLLVVVTVLRSRGVL